LYDKAARISRRCAAGEGYAEFSAERATLLRRVARESTTLRLKFQTSGAAYVRKQESAASAQLHGARRRCG